MANGMKPKRTRKRVKRAKRNQKSNKKFK